MEGICMDWLTAKAVEISTSAFLLINKQARKGNAATAEQSMPHTSIVWHASIPYTFLYRHSYIFWWRLNSENRPLVTKIQTGKPVLYYGAGHRKTNIWCHRDTLMVSLIFGNEQWVLSAWSLIISGGSAQVFGNRSLNKQSDESDSYQHWTSFPDQGKVTLSRNLLNQLLLATLTVCWYLWWSGAWLNVCSVMSDRN